MFLLAAAFVLHTMLIVRPDIIVSKINTNYTRASVVFSLITFFTAMAWTELAKLIFLQWFAEWKVYKELTLTLSCILWMGCLNYLYIYFFGKPQFATQYFRLRDLWDVTMLTLLSGLVPLLILTLIQFLRLEKTKKDSVPVLSIQKEETTDSPKELHINEGNEIFELKLPEVSMIESMGNYVKIYQVQGQVNRVCIKRITMKRMEELLTAQQFLIRIHRLYFVNISHIERVHKDTSGTMCLVFRNLDRIVPVSRSKRKQIYDMLKYQNVV
jgi:hypothetical protein